MVTTPSRKRLHRLLRRDLGSAVTRGKGSTWTTTSGLPHEIRLHVQSGIELVRVSAGAVVGTRATKPLLRAINSLNVERAYSRRILVEDKVLVVAELPLASVRRGDLEQLVSMVLCCARLDARLLSAYGGRPVTDPPPELAPALHETVRCWDDVLRASRTATARELAVLLDELAGCDCWIDFIDDSVVVVVDGIGTGHEYPFVLDELRESAVDLLEQEPDLEDD